MKNNENEHFDYIRNEKEFEKNRDLIMKAVESDLRIVAWICWGIGLLFEEYTYKNMLNYISKVTIDELKEFIEPLSEVIPSEFSSNAVLDKFFLIKENGIPKYVLNLENQTKPYPLEENEARAFYYLCSMVSWEAGNVFTTDEYKNIIPPVAVWILPNDAKIRLNHIFMQITDVPTHSYGMDLNLSGSGVFEEVAPFFNTNMYLYKFCIGNPLEISEPYLERNDKEGKLTVLIQLLDILFNFKLSQDERIRLASERFSLKGKYINMEAKAMAEIAAMINNLVNSEIDNRIYEYEENENNLKKKIEKKDQEIETKDKEIETKDKELETKDKELEAKDQEIETKNKEIAELKEEVKRFRERFEIIDPNED